MIKCVPFPYEHNGYVHTWYFLGELCRLVCSSVYVFTFDLDDELVTSSFVTHRGKLVARKATYVGL